jgi:hypothetical protein
MGVSPDQMRELQDELRRRLGDVGGMTDLFGPEEPSDETPPAQDQTPLDDLPPDDRPPENPQV